MKMIAHIIIVLVLFGACQSGPKTDSGLKLIPRDQIVDRVKKGNFNYLYAQFLNQDGSEMTDTQRQQLNKGLLGKDYYENKDGQIMEIRVRPIELEDKFVEIQRRELSSNPMAEISIIDIDCNNLDQIYHVVDSTDQDVRIRGGDMQLVDELNQQIVVSALQKCGFTEDHIRTIWLVLQHSSSGLISYYYADLKRYTDDGILPGSSMALMEDRLLMWNGYKQIYGSQIMNNSLYDLEDPLSVDERRARVGLGPLEEYVDRFGLDLAEEIKRMQSESE